MLVVQVVNGPRDLKEQVPDLVLVELVCMVYDVVLEVSAVCPLE